VLRQKISFVHKKDYDENTETVRGNVRFLFGLSFVHTRVVYVGVVGESDGDIKFGCCS